MAVSFIDLETWNGSLIDQETWGDDDSFGLGPVTLAVSGTVGLPTSQIDFALPHALGNVLLAITGGLGFPASNVSFGSNGFTLDPPVTLLVTASLGVSGNIGYDQTNVFQLGPTAIALSGILGLSGDVVTEDLFVLGPVSLAMQGSLGVAGSTGVALAFSIGSTSLALQGTTVVSASYLGPAIKLPGSVRTKIRRPGKLIAKLREG